MQTAKGCVHCGGHRITCRQRKGEIKKKKRGRKGGEVNVLRNAEWKVQEELLFRSLLPNSEYLSGEECQVIQKFLGQVTVASREHRKLALVILYEGL